ncbi:sensor histidine kinase [Geobacter argillaceus]|uniref:histidine kinase n=1 Tax=Geobacter argillaceus TaxID=345631 RepID=A0A562VI35_9BACT|nr:ATP-binding protein [Geobacter argillaceus]TWJ17569.1 heavy metal sensor kinase [Geobacter argillaceus]
MRLKPASVRIRLTIWYTAALAGIVLCFALGIYLFVRSSLLRQIDGQLYRDLATVTRVARDEPNEMNELAQHGSVALFQVSEGNEVLAETDGWSRFGLEKAVAGRRLVAPWSWEAPNDLYYRLKIFTVAAPGHTYFVAVAEDEQTLRQSLESLAIILLFGIPLALALAVIGGYFLAGRALAPIGAMAAKAGEITAERLSERLPIEDPHDEFGRLATVFNQTFARIEDSFERLRRFTADASHELRTPLTAIRSVGEVGLQENADAAACREVVASMLEEADRLTKLVDSLLTLSRADAGSVQVKREPTDLSLLAVEVADCIQVLAEEKEQSLVVDAPEPVIAGIDPTTLRQALINLVDNAVKYTPKQGHIRVKVRSTAGEAIIEVIDDGPGIAKEHQARIFDRFYRVDKGRSRDMGGTGLGLAITRWAVEVNDGRIELESEEGEGSTFRIVLSAVHWKIS